MCFKYYRNYNVIFMQKIKKKAQWSKQELDLLNQLYHEFSSKKWKRIAESFRQKGFNRTQIECREKWINFLDPELNKSDWTYAELQKLYEIHDQVGTKWCVIQKYIGRTQNKIKNRFYGTLRNYIRFVMNYFDGSNKCYNYEISKLSPNFLNSIYKAESQFRFLNEEIKDTIFQMRFKIDKKILMERINLRKPLYLRLRTLVYKTFKEINAQKNKKNQDQSYESQVMEDEKLLINEVVIQDVIIQKEMRQIKLDQTRQKQEIEQPLIDMKNYYPFLNYPYENYPFQYQ